MNEEWQPVPGYEGAYEVSNLGRIRSLSRSVYRRNSTPWTIQTRILKLQDHRQGYKLVTLPPSLETNRQRRTLKIHRLVAKAFIPNPKGLPLVLHGSQGVRDNSVVNLRWGTHSDNVRDAIKDGVHPQSSKTHCPQGHPYSELNTSIYSARNARSCMICNRAKTARYAARKKAANQVSNWKGESVE